MATTDVHDEMQHASFGGQSHMATTDVHDLILPIFQPTPQTQAFEPAEGQFGTSGMGTFHEACQPMEFVHSSDMELQNPLQSTPAVERQESILHGPYAMPMMTQNQHMINGHYPVTLPSFAA
ncbi:uncharacterized protein N7483_010764 [Penicillium malachiteum]|uniref:uncharacterized protein n=1 Tax=Penicillium malachiteum TaxID=1324776 RepID=UPI00254891D2|nr:uncharacterized protein N7483_010764 [Penicillium malachiteum]KAJ5713583.1 hypothetical protein N7483_010764 [Penicillium malachiteum]